MNPKIAKQVMIRQTSKTPQLLADPFSQIQIEEKEKKSLKKNLKLKSNYQQIQKAKSSDEPEITAEAPADDAHLRLTFMK